MGASVKPKKEDFLRSHRGIVSFKQNLPRESVGRENQKGFKTGPEKPAIMPPKEGE
jgi:hypothetical protein